MQEPPPMQTQRTDLRTRGWVGVGGEEERLGLMERTAWKHIHNHMENR